MKRLRILVLGALALSALTLAAGATTASANVLLAESYPATLSGTSVAEGLNVEFSFGGAYKCTGGLSGSASAPSEKASMSLPAEQTCTTGSLKSNGCQLTLRPGAETSPGVFGGTFEIASGCSGLGVNFFGCQVNFPPQSGAATYENGTWEGKSVTTVKLNGSAMEYTSSGTGCSPGTYHNGSIYGSFRLSSSTSGTTYGIHVANRSGLFLGGEGSPEGSNPPRFELEHAPAAVIGKQTTLEKIETAAGTFKCEYVNLNKAVSQSTNEIVFEPEFSRCKAFGLTAAVQVNGCKLGAFVLGASPYWGTFGLGCSGENKLEVNAGGGSCILLIPPQALARNSYEVVGTGAERKVVATMKNETLEYTQSGLGCAGGSGTFHNGIVSGAETFEGWS